MKNSWLASLDRNNMKGKLWNIIAVSLSDMVMHFWTAASRRDFLSVDSLTRSRCNEFVGLQSCCCIHNWVFLTSIQLSYFIFVSKDKYVKRMLLQLQKDTFLLFITKPIYSSWCLYFTTVIVKTTRLSTVQMSFFWARFE